MPGYDKDFFFEKTIILNSDESITIKNKFSSKESVKITPKITEDGKIALKMQAESYVELNTSMDST